MLAPVCVPQVPAPALDADDDSIEDLAQQARKACGLAPGPVPNVVELLENHGIVVLRLPLDTADVDAFSLPFPDRPVIVLGSDKNDKGRSRFDGAHELGHLVMHGERVWGLKAVEDQAHKSAAAFLMPAQDIYKALPTRADWNALFRLKQHWQVSLAALLMRAKTLKRIDDAAYLTGVKALCARGWRRVEPVPLESRNNPSGYADSSPPRTRTASAKPCPTTSSKPSFRPTRRDRHRGRPVPSRPLRRTDNRPPGRTGRLGRRVPGSMTASSLRVCTLTSICRAVGS